ncbi:energy-coupling factor transporter transmembrane component T family protein [Clostridium cochlearium]|jgi:energy-coupling factor transport system permease protein|uniref:Energy-coupling factor transporter transmembrane protein EcfT n=1 Tax=Clostridium cochlearium TaxID=1494 RepID=A0A240B0F0_CLOCO|nr:energy-coupling factor transporter transmembrane protein EcfT [Clostridium cochlearium]MBV1817589.1 energy-coupling factor transporter transmembrane protein EcfT [Bacteroidales bacterium MSK.15.36]NSJ90213.1 energy-coupling factor transporter transmembrane protein EcfT [Coprococcus sp. MSK.21.13]MBE6065053.1 energy-coupling factor transporter transmembrane protein EcfT [Clostridium cochlearium]MBU5269856.1 energy-coupling factor transporter transmembrane protein EcfT [Clostridium cochlearium
MIKDITLGQYIPGDSFIHKLDPRVKIIISLIYIINLFIINNFKGYVLIIAFTAIAILISRVPFKFIYRGLKPIFIMIIITALLNIFMTSGGDIVFQWRFITIYEKGLQLAIFMVIRLVLLIIGTSLLTLTTSPIELTDGIEKLLNPFKKVGVPAHELAMMMTIALRFIPTLMDETDKIMKAQMARGADFETGNIVKRAKSLIPILVPLFISSFRRAEELAMAMEARCYRGGEGRTRMKQLKLEGRDFVACLTMLILVGISIWSRV